MATVQLDTHFVEVGQIGDILISPPARGGLDAQPHFHEHRSQAWTIVASGPLDNSWIKILKGLVALERLGCRSNHTHRCRCPA